MESRYRKCFRLHVLFHRYIYHSWLDCLFSSLIYALCSLSSRKDYYNQEGKLKILKMSVESSKTSSSANPASNHWKFVLKTASGEIPCSVQHVPTKQIFKITVKDRKSPMIVTDNFNLSDLIIRPLIDDSEKVMQIMKRSVGGHVSLQFLGTNHEISVMNELAHKLYTYMPEKKVVDTSSVIIAPMPGLVKSISAEVGQKVSEGQELCVLEAMKMQNSMTAGKAGVVKAVNFKAGETVSEDDVIIELE